MGYVAWIDGSGWTVQLDDNGAHLIKSHVLCPICGDDRVLKGKMCFKCDQIAKQDIDRKPDA